MSRWDVNPDLGYLDSSQYVQYVYIVQYVCYGELFLCLP